MFSSTRGQEALCCTVDIVDYVFCHRKAIQYYYGNYCHINLNYLDQSQPKNMPRN